VLLDDGQRDERDVQSAVVEVHTLEQMVVDGLVVVAQEENEYVVYVEAVVGDDRVGDAAVAVREDGLEYWVADPCE
jgi:hypothetical protein